MRGKQKRLNKNQSDNQLQILLAALSLLKDTRSVLSVSTLSYICMLFSTFVTSAGYVEGLQTTPIPRIYTDCYNEGARCQGCWQLCEFLCAPQWLRKKKVNSYQGNHWRQHKEYQGSPWMHSCFWTFHFWMLLWIGKKNLKRRQGCSEALNGFTKWVVDQRSSLPKDIVNVTVLHV